MYIPTIFEALEERLTEHGLQWNDIKIVTLSEGTLSEGVHSKIAGAYSGKTRYVDRNQAAEIFKKGRILNEHGYTEPDNLPFYAYTKDRIFYMGYSDEMGGHWIGSLPRNPTDKEPARHLPS